jgi:uncharacterized protein
MLVKIEEIQGTKALELSEPIARRVLDEALAESEGYSLVEPSKLFASFKKVSGQVHVTGSFSPTVKGPCKRCLADVTLTVPVEFNLRMVQEARRPRADDEDEEGAKPAGAPEDDGRTLHAGSFELDQVDAEPFNGKTIDLDPVVREQVLLALPVSVLCREECKGLCATCGQDLNEKDCGHGQVKAIDPRLAKLKDLKLN